MSHLILIIWNGKFAPLPWDGGTGYSVGRKWAHGMSASSRVCSLRVACKVLIPLFIWSLSSSALILIPPSTSSSSPPACGNNTLPKTRSAQTSIASVNNVAF